MSTHRCLVVKQMIKMKIPHPPLCARVTLLHCLFVCTCIFLRLLCVLVLWDQQMMPAVVLAMQPSKLFSFWAPAARRRCGRHSTQSGKAVKLAVARPATLQRSAADVPSHPSGSRSLRYVLQQAAGSARFYLVKLFILKKFISSFTIKLYN